MKILILSDQFPPKDNGGAGLIAALQAKGLKNRGHDIQVITANQPEAIYIYEGIQVQSIASNYPQRFRKFFALQGPFVVGKIVKQIKKFKPDIIHFHNVHTTLSYRSIQKTKKLCDQVFITLHDHMSINWGKVPGDCGVLPESKLSKKIKAILKEIQVIGISKAQIAVLKKNGVRIDHQLYNGLEPGDSNSGKVQIEKIKTVQAKHRIPGNKALFLFAGRISKMKGRDALLKAIEKSKGHLLVVGAKGENKNNISYINSVPYEEIETFYRMSRAVLVPSICLDVFPTVALEAFKFARPVIGSIYGGLPEIIDDGQNGSILDPADTALFSEKIDFLASNEEEALKMGQDGEKKLRECLSLDIHIDKLLEIYQKSKLP